MGCLSLSDDEPWRTAETEEEEDEGRAAVEAAEAAAVARRREDEAAAVAAAACWCCTCKWSVWSRNSCESRTVAGTGRFPFWKKSEVGEGEEEEACGGCGCGCGDACGDGTKKGGGRGGGGGGGEGGAPECANNACGAEDSGISIPSSVTRQGTHRKRPQLSGKAR